jgi:hypothetical protein
MSLGKPNKSSSYVPPILIIIDILSIFLVISYISSLQAENMLSFQFISFILILTYTLNMLYIASKGWE